MSGWVSLRHRSGPSALPTIDELPNVAPQVIHCKCQKLSFQVIPKTKKTWVSLKRQINVEVPCTWIFHESPFVASFVAHNTWWPVRLSPSASVSPPRNFHQGSVAISLWPVQPVHHKSTSNWFEIVQSEEGFFSRTKQSPWDGSSRPNLKCSMLGDVLEIMHRYESSWSVHMHQTCSGKRSPQIVLTQSRAQSQSF